MGAEFSAIRRDMVTRKGLAKQLALLATKKELSEVKTQMRVLHEDLVERLKVLGDAWGSSDRVAGSKGSQRSQGSQRRKR
jgi:hypothetical protein